MTTAPDTEWVLEGQEGQEHEAETTEQVVEETPSPTLEDLASELGWKPKDQWKGDASGWTPAADYLRTTYAKQRDGADRLKQVQQQSRTKDREIDGLVNRLGRLEKVSHTMLREQERTIRAQVHDEYEQAKKVAAKEGDDAKYDRLSAEQLKADRDIAKEFREKEPQQEPDVEELAKQQLNHPLIGRFWRDHAWVAEDEEAYQLAFAVCEEEAKTGASITQQLKMAREALRDAYPDKFKGRAAPVEEDGQARDESGRFVKQDAAPAQQQQQRRPPVVANGQRMAAKPSAEQAALAALPPEARSIYEAQKKAGTFTGDIVKFAKIYNGEVVSVLD